MSGVRDRELVFSEQVTALVSPDVRGRLDAQVIRRKLAGIAWPGDSLGSVLRDVIDAGLDPVERTELP